MATIFNYQKSTTLWMVPVFIGQIQLILAFIIWGCVVGSTTVVSNKNGVTNLCLTTIPLMSHCAILQVLINQQKYGKAALVSAIVAVLSLYLATAVVSMVICVQIYNPREPKCTYIDKEQEIAVIGFAMVQMIISVLQIIFLSIISKPEIPQPHSDPKTLVNIGPVVGPEMKYSPEFLQPQIADIVEQPASNSPYIG